eukprot:scaffold5981_cov141-Isochrysis_galbana.AAC.8
MLAISPPAVAAFHRMRLEGYGEHASPLAGSAPHPNSRCSCPAEWAATSMRAFAADCMSNPYLVPLLRNLDLECIKLSSRLLL